MNNSPSSSNMVMATVILLETARRKLRKNLKKKRASSGHQAEKTATTKHTNRAKRKGGNPETGGPSAGKSLTEDQATANATISTNPFATLNPPEDQPELEEGEVQQNMEQTTDAEINSGSQQQTVEAISETPGIEAIQQENQGPLVGTTSPPSYAEMTKKKKLIDSPGSFEDEPFEQSNKKAGRKSRKEIKEEEVERLKTQGSQSTIKMSLGRNTRTRPPKGGSAPPPSSK